jgi:comEA protein
VGRARTTAGSALPIGVTPLVMTVFRSRIEITLLITAAVLFLCCKTALAQKTPPTQPVNINTATIEELQKLPGVGPNTAKAIVDFRNHSGPFRRVEDLLAIKGISKSKLEKLRPYVTVAPAAPNHHSASSRPALVIPVFSSANFQKAV